MNRSSNILRNLPKPVGQLTGAIGFVTQVCVCITVVCDGAATAPVVTWAGVDTANGPVVGTIAGATTVLCGTT